MCRCVDVSTQSSELISKNILLLWHRTRIENDDDDDDGG